jgi:hypothetical protein
MGDWVRGDWVTHGATELLDPLLGAGVAADERSGDTEGDPRPCGEIDHPAARNARLLEGVRIGVGLAIVHHNQIFRQNMLGKYNPTTERCKMRSRMSC